MKFVGYAKGRKLIIIIGTGSGCSFINEFVAKRLGMKISKAPTLAFKVAGGENMYSRAVCEGCNWTMQGHAFEFDLRLLQLGGCDILLGGDWLAQFGPMTVNFGEHKVSFYRGEELIELQMNKEADEAESQTPSNCLAQEWGRSQSSDNQARLMSITLQGVVEESVRFPTEKEILAAMEQIMQLPAEKESLADLEENGAISFQENGSDDSLDEDDVEPDFESSGTNELGAENLSCASEEMENVNVGEISMGLMGSY